MIASFVLDAPAFLKGQRCQDFLLLVNAFAIQFCRFKKLVLYCSLLKTDGKSVGTEVI